jgi:hypothetical protein
MATQIELPVLQKPKNKPVTQSQKIINQLRTAGNKGVANHALANYNLGYRGRITELRQDGYNIHCERQIINGRSTGVWMYYLTEEQEL